MRLTDRLRLLEGRPTLVAIATMNAITGLAVLIVWAPLAAGADAATFRNGAIGIAHGELAYGFLYAPLFGLILTPLTWLSEQGAAVVMSGIGVAILGVGIARETRGLATLDRWLIAVAVLGFAPVVHELLLGQVTLVIAASMYLVRDGDGWRRGILLGILVALIPKPVFLPILAWMVVWQRRSLFAAGLAAVATTAVGIVVAGPDLYRAWLVQLLGTASITRQGNLSLTSLGSLPLEAVGLALVGILWLSATTRSREAGFVASILAATLAAPFTFAYGVTVVLVAIKPSLSVVPRATRLLALTASLSVIGAYLLWGLAGMLACAMRARGTRAADPTGDEAGQA